MPNFSGTWTTRQQMQAKGASTWPATPGAPTIGTATAGSNKCASVAFTAPSCTGRFPTGVTGYQVISTPGCFTATGSSSPLTVTGLTAGTSYTFKAQATNGNGYGALSAASNSVTATIVTCATYTTAGSYSWVAPSGVTSVAVVAVGGGAYGCYNGTYAGGAGGGLGYKNAITVTPGNSYTVAVGRMGQGVCCGRTGGNSYFINTSTVKGGGGAQTGTGLGGTYTGDGGGNGGNGGPPKCGLSSGAGGGGAGGYSGNGGTGGATLVGRSGSAGAACSGAGGGGGAGYRGCCGCYRAGGNGGGVGLYGKGSTGAGGTGGYPTPNTTGGQGGAGSGGTNATYGGGTGYNRCCGSLLGRGAVRIVWCKCGVRGTPSFPSTNVGA